MYVFSTNFVTLKFADWFAAGKGPNPVVAALDKDMDNYFKDRVEKEEKEGTPPVANNE
jgi:hypothetical protein